MKQSLGRSKREEVNRETNVKLSAGNRSGMTAGLVVLPQSQGQQRTLLEFAAAVQSEQHTYATQ